MPTNHDKSPHSPAHSPPRESRREFCRESSSQSRKDKAVLTAQNSPNPAKISATPHCKTHHLLPFCIFDIKIFLLAHSDISSHSVQIKAARPFDPKGRHLSANHQRNGGTVVRLRLSFDIIKILPENKSPLALYLKDTQARGHMGVQLNKSPIIFP